MDSQKRSKEVLGCVAANSNRMQHSVLSAIESERSRLYQLEMYDASMERNTVVVMIPVVEKPMCKLIPSSLARLVFANLDSAVIRIKAELERCPPQKLIWFLAPTVALCEQQHNVLRINIPSAQIRLLIGSDNVDRWSEQKIWDIVLKNVRIVVSTHGVLADALSHGFVGMERLALLVFDEAHHCVRGHPANKIMKDYYHPFFHLHGPNAVPHILGLTASPVIRSKPTDRVVLERNLNAICMTPRIHRAELLEYVHPPIFVRLTYSPNCEPIASSPLVSLMAVYNKALASQMSQNWDRAALIQKPPTEKVLDELKKFCSKACHIYDELGQWAADYYIKTSIDNLNDSESIQGTNFFYKKDDRKDILLELLRQVQSTDSIIHEGMQIAQKGEELIRFLVSHEQDQLHGIIFVEQRATVAVLHKLLSVHPQTKDVLKCGTFIGISTSSSRKASIGDWLDPSKQQHTLENFRKQEKNLIIATSVLEEGIDISACNVVICFNKPANIKSFIQRRGRARKNHSIFVLMLSLDDQSLGPHEWEDMERKMSEAYQKDASERSEIQRMEDFGEHGDSRFQVESTGVVLTLETAMAHIHHFCATLPPQPYVDLRPSFLFREDPTEGLVTATITLPNCVDPSVRTASSHREWRTERMAKKDAAFQAYVALYKKGLVNENLLPLLGRDEEMEINIETRAALEEVSETYDPWVTMAKNWMGSRVFLHRKIVAIDRPGRTALCMAMILPQKMPSFGPFAMYWDERTTYMVSISDHMPNPAIDSTFLPTMRRATSTILQSIYSRRMTSGRNDFLALFLPDIDEGDLESWLEVNAGEFPAPRVIDTQFSTLYGLVREPSLHGVPHIFQGMADDTSIKVIALSKRRDFLHHYPTVKSDSTENKSGSPTKKTLVLPLQSSSIDKLSQDYVECSLLIPSVMRRLWRYALALDLSSSVLQDVGFVNIEHICTATNAPSANEATNYQRLKFVGDSVLKYLVAVHLYAVHKSWPEGYLSIARDRIVANSRLARAAIEIGLDCYIVTRAFAAKKWSPPYIQEVLQAASLKKRTISTKVLADVVEALIGGAFLDGGIERAVICTCRLLPEIPATSPRHIFDGTTDMLDEQRPTPLANDHFEDIERLIGYKFKRRSLLREAMTHPSCEHDAQTSSYQRLEFVGDAALDMIVVSYVVDNAPELTHGRMHLIKTAMVNASFLAYLCLNASVEQAVIDVSLGTSSNDFQELHSSRLLRLCHFMRHQHRDVTIALSNSLERYRQMQHILSSALEQGLQYPWVLLTSLAPEKFLSDIVESIFGAVLVDAKGDLKACMQVAEKLGLLTYLRRILKEYLDILHPKNRLGEIAGDRTVEYVLGIEGESDGYSCTVKVGGKSIVTVLNGSSQNEVMTRAANTAIELLGQ